MFDACYQRCVQPQPTTAMACPTNHEWCVLACRTGQDPVYRAMPHWGGRSGAEVLGRAQLAQTVSVETLGGVASPILRRCIDLPFEVTDVYSTSQANQPTIEVHLVAGEAVRAADNQTLGSWTFQGVRAAPVAVPRIQVRFHAEKAGRLTIGARDLDTGQELTVVQNKATYP